MTDRLGLPRGRQLALDVALVGVFVAMLVNRLFLGVGTPRGIAGSAAWTLPFFLVGYVALLWRRRYAATVAVVYFTPIGVHAYLTGNGVEGAFVLFPALLVLYSLGAYATEWRLVAGVLGTVALSALHDTHDPFLQLSNPSEVWAYLLWVVVQGVVLLVGVVIASRRRSVATARRARELEEQQRQGVASERAKIARELHDVVTHNVNVVVMQAMAAHGVLDSDPELARAPLEAIETSGREALVEMRRMLGVLRDEVDNPLSPQPGPSDIARLAAGVRGAGVDVQCALDGDLEGVPDGVGIAAYRIVQEALTNAMKHAAGAPVRISVSADDQEVRVLVHNSPGAPGPTSSGAGQGLIGMRERALLFGGEVDARRTDDGGFRVAARLPLGPE